MITNNINEQQLQVEIDQLKIQFPQTRDLYREACVLLFFRHGITPTANKLYQLVRRGSMSAPAEALNKFWLELREKSRIRIESPDIPEELKESAGTFISTLWRQAQEAAVSSLSVHIADANDKVMQSMKEAETASRHMAEAELELEAAKAQLNNAETQITELEKIHAVDINASATQEKALKALIAERDSLSRTLEETRSRFSEDLGRLSDSLLRTENQYRSLEKKSLLELDRERQNVIKLENVTAKLRESSKTDQDRCRKDISLLQDTISNLKEKLGALNGKISEITGQQKEISAKLKQTEKKLEAANSKIFRLTAQRPKKAN
ncbi:MAG: DNA-binding protein [Sideroxyarcus sp.]|nr:DNA-binding protein [Sideroxyarcus sp.]